MYDIYVRSTPKSRWELYRAWTEGGLADCLCALSKRKVKPDVKVYPAVDLGMLVFNLKTFEYRQVTGVGIGTVEVFEECVDIHPRVWNKSDIVPVEAVNVDGISGFNWVCLGGASV